MTPLSLPVKHHAGVLTVGAARRFAAETLAAAGVASPWADAGILLSFVSGVPYRELGGRAGEGVAPGDAARLWALTRRRAAGEPAQLIVGVAPFLGLELPVRAGVFIPRAETEGLAVLAESLIAEVSAPVVVDLYAGVGPLAVYLARRFPAATVLAVEADALAAALIKENAAAYDVTVGVLPFDVGAAALAERLPAADLVVANPPYIKTADVAALPAEVRDWEPRAALDGGVDGLACYPVIADFARRRLKAGGTLAVEIAEEGGAAVSRIFEPVGDTEVKKDLAGRDRYVTARRR
jgi:release factor glutamine methyltransferase